MARYRTIKPELWTDPEFVECSPNARLLFVAALNFASDYGVLMDSPVQLKMQCYPGDSIDVGPLVAELVRARLWLRTTAPDGAKVLVIRTFVQHQRVDKPQEGRWGDWRKWDEFVERSENAPGPVDDDSRLKERTSVKNERTEPSAELVLNDTVEAYRGAPRREDTWSALEHELGPAQTTTERNVRGKTRKELDGLAVTPQQIHERCQEYRRRWPDVSLTDSALLKHWSALAEAHVVAPRMNAGTAALLTVAREAAARRSAS